MEKPSLTQDYKEFIELLNSHRVDYLVIGGWCLAFHGEPRLTGDLDIWIRRTPNNAEKVETVINAFGFANVKPPLTKEIFLQPNQIIQLGYKPNRIDILTDLSSLSFDRAWTSRNEITVGDIRLVFLDRESLIASKRAAGREQDLRDIRVLEQTRAKKQS